MIYRITLPFKHSEADLRKAIALHFGRDCPYRILKRSIDARQHGNIRVEYAVSSDVSDPAEDVRAAVEQQRGRLEKHFSALRPPVPVVVGAGPGGLFCALWLLMHGLRPVVLEQGTPMRERLRDMARFMKNGVLHPYSNICFGAGGAGAYSDGKLVTRIRSPFIPFVMSVFVEHGAPEEIRYLYNPHLGSNRIRRCITGLLSGLESSGVDIRYGVRLADMELDENGGVLGLLTAESSNAGAARAVARLRLSDGGAVFLAAGHSSRETYAMLRARGAAMDAKDFAVGVRVEHPAAAVDEMQYGEHSGTRYPGIETAQYRLAKTWKDENRAVYSFCMCPGGYVINASTGSDGVVSNGMSNALKSGRFSNAAVVVNISRDDLSRMGFTGVDAALEFQKELEERCRGAVNAAGSSNTLPGQLLNDFMQGAPSRSLKPASCLNPIAPAPLHDLMPDFVTEALRRGFIVFDRKMRGFASHADAQLFGCESRTSSPYRVHRDPDSLMSLSHPGLYPVGEGAGYAGGITSAAVDGIRCAQAWLGRFISVEPFDSFKESGEDTRTDA